MNLHVSCIYDYYDFPVTFTAKNDADELFICVFAKDNGNTIKYLCTKLKQFDFLQLFINAVDLRSIFLKNFSDIYEIDYTQESGSCLVAKKVSKVDKNFLPAKNTYLNDDFETLVYNPALTICATSENEASYTTQDGIWMDVA